MKYCGKLKAIKNFAMVGIDSNNRNDQFICFKFDRFYC